MSTTYYNETKVKDSQKPDENVVDLNRQNYYLLCSECLWMASMLSSFPSKYLEQHHNCPVCSNRISRFLIGEPAN